MTGTLDLFADSVEVAGPEVFARDWMARPWRCPVCGRLEGNGWLLELNHGISQDSTMYGFPLGAHQNYGAQCTLQILKTNHLAWAATHPCIGDDGLPDGGARFAAETAACRAIGLDVDQIITEARTRAGDRS